MTADTISPTSGRAPGSPNLQPEPDRPVQEVGTGELQPLLDGIALLARLESELRAFESELDSTRLR